MRHKLPRTVSGILYFLQGLLLCGGSSSSLPIAKIAWLQDAQITSVLLHPLIKDKKTLQSQFVPASLNIFKERTVQSWTCHTPCVAEVVLAALGFAGYKYYSRSQQQAGFLHLCLKMEHFPRSSRDGQTAGSPG